MHNSAYKTLPIEFGSQNNSKLNEKNLIAHLSIEN